jgi:hypothetical protein
MQAADFADWDNHAELGWVDRPPIRCIFGEGEMCSGAVVIAEVASQDATQVALAEDDNVVETVAPDRADKALRERILPGAVRRRKNFLDPHALHAVAKLLAVHLVTVAQEIGWRGVVRERGDDLLRGPDGGGMLGDVEVDDPPAMVGKHHEDEQDAEARGGHGESMETKSWTWLSRNVRQV